MSKAKFFLTLDQEAIDDLEVVARENHMSPNAFAAVAVGRLSKLKPEFALAALGSIPQEYFKRGPGRPPTSGKARDSLAATS